MKQTPVLVVNMLVVVVVVGGGGGGGVLSIGMLVEVRPIPLVYNEQHLVVSPFHETFLF